ncbi:MAG: hypothetical protein ACLSAF_17430 [Intestinimonas sp.]
MRWVRWRFGPDLRLCWGYRDRHHHVLCRGGMLTAGIGLLLLGGVVFLVGAALRARPGCWSVSCGEEARA